MRIDTIIVLVCEWIAFLCWAINIKKVTETRYRLFTIYLGIIACAELLNYFFGNDGKGWTNWVNVHVIVFIQFIFFIWFLLYNNSKKSKNIALIFTAIFCSGFLIEMTELHINTGFSSLSFGIGSLLLLISIIIALYQMFSKPNTAAYNQTTKFWIVMGLITFYVGAFPYENFRNHLWNNPGYYKMAYFLHYLSQAFNCIMYLAFAYSVKWKIK